MDEIDEILANIDNDDVAPVDTSDEIKEVLNVSGDESSGNQDADAVENPKDVDADDAGEQTSKGSAGQGTGPSDNIVGTDKHSSLIENKLGVKFSVKGNKSWNNKEPYIISINEKALQNDLVDLKSSFYFVSEPTKPDDVREAIKKEIVTFLRRPEENITGRYIEFIYKMITRISEEISEAYKIDGVTKNLFMYHAGPLTIFRITKGILEMDRYGFCYKYVPGNRALRYFPEEFIKAKILKWYEENINILDLPYNNLKEYDEIKDIASKKYQVMLKAFNARLNKLNSKVSAERAISRDRLFRLKSVQWFGIINIEICKRFIGRSIFT